MSPIITLTTDFGLNDAYVAAMKGVILGINPEVTLVDICHTIEPQNIAQAAFVLDTAYQSFPRGTVHLAVVDPGVGSHRRAVILRTASADFVAPDNGALSYVIREASPEGTEGKQPAGLRPELEAFAISEPRFWRTPVSPTFHGRDIFAPVAAYLSLGHPPADFGERLNSLVMLPLTNPEQKRDGSVLGHILHIDSFGNLITDITAHDLPTKSEMLSIKVGEQTIQGLVRTYAEGEGLLALIASSGYLEVAFKEGGAAALLGAGVGSEVRVRRKDIG